MTAETDLRSLIEQGRKLFAGDWQFIWAYALDRNPAAGSGLEWRFCRTLQRRQIQPHQRPEPPRRAGADLAHARRFQEFDLLRRTRKCRLSGWSK